MIIEYNFQEFTDKDMFKIKLKDAIPDFGYISNKFRRLFIIVMVERGFLKDQGPVKDRLETYNDSQILINRYKEFRNHYIVLVPFQYSEMKQFSPEQVNMYEQQDVFTHTSWKIIGMQL